MGSHIFGPQQDSYGPNLIITRPIAYQEIGKRPKSIRQEKIPKPYYQDDVAARTTVAAVEPLSSRIV
ncbi:hypothetical protein Prudu_011362 [Prunus dulcis]|uniref:Uncharacterized protein n=1 Tax=Prunus dulcis TaxID=3755 RepID=A0A4Y1RBD5_PRUDU|nr:hypothetical protein Prudu_011362 [Prunus dulcis]